MMTEGMEDREVVASASADAAQQIRERLEFIAAGRGKFARDQLTFASNVIDDAKEKATECLALLDVLRASAVHSAQPVSQSLSAVRGGEVTPEHRCGVRGFDQMRGDVCPACAASRGTPRAVPSAARVSREDAALAAKEIDSLTTALAACRQALRDLLGAIKSGQRRSMEAMDDTYVPQISVAWLDGLERRAALDAGPPSTGRAASSAEVVLTHVVDPHEHGGRFGEDVLSVKCRFCATVWTDEAEFSSKKIGDQACPARAASDRERADG